MTTGPTGSLTVVDVPERCGNAPRKAVIRDFTIAVVAKEASGVTALLSADAHWTLNGARVLHGPDEVRDWLLGEPDATALKIHTLITHGTECGVDGEVTRTDGGTVAFSHVMRFTGGAPTARIKELRSYLVEIQGSRPVA